MHFSVEAIFMVKRNLKYKSVIVLEKGKYVKLKVKNVPHYHVLYILEIIHIIKHSKPYMSYFSILYGKIPDFQNFPLTNDSKIEKIAVNFPVFVKKACMKFHNVDTQCTLCSFF